ncbi:unnamed protein product [Lepeophtheirus salmonis]|uniref:(salmon louse) hypothetical protein n=1 Tax=Lepeophtheirus salmonis TaxID=72036 RepID=A0A7R8HBP5_LEPSM|nr:unnamed protein product [Lepeophtheirus salmonis]CAF2975784.1 unnamed protein product [Lepeophtheirus salmonis]
MKADWTPMEECIDPAKNVGLGGTLYSNKTLNPQIIAQNWASEQISSNFTNKGNVEKITRNIFVEGQKLPGVPNGKGQRCIIKVVQVQETEYDRGMSCQHTIKKKCHVTYVTDYVSAPETKCESTFKKNCHITFKAVPFSAQVKKCYTPLNHKCEGKPEGPKVCRNVYENQCETQYKNYDLEQDEPVCKIKDEIRCKTSLSNSYTFPMITEKEVSSLLPNCKPVPEPEVCHEQTQTQIQNIPEENCDIEPEENCRVELVLVPKLIPKDSCVNIPKVVCVPIKKNPKIISKPVLKEWCYNPKDYIETGDNMGRGDN